MTSSSTTSIQQALAYSVEQSLLHPQASQLALLQTRDKAANSEAKAFDALLAENPSCLPLAGTILTVKACFDANGWVSHAGSRVLANGPAASNDAPLLAQLRRAGAVLRAQTNMTEFAYGALGLNPWYGTPTTPLMPDESCVAGGSSSGAAVAVALGMANVSLGSDTSGSVRIPAAFCGVTGFKPSKGRYPSNGLLHLSPSFDVPGVITDSASRCLQVDNALLCQPAQHPAARHAPSLRGLRLVVPDTWLSSLLDNNVGKTFERWLQQLSTAGVQIQSCALPMLAEAGRVASEGGIIATEAYQIHAHRLDQRLSEYDPKVGPRVLLGANVKAHTYISAQNRLQQLATDYDHALGWADAVLTPTVPMLPPTVASLQDDSIYASQNRRAFQLTEFANRLDAPSISLPGNLQQRQPIGLLLTGKRGNDAALLAMAVSIENFLSSQ